MRQVLVLTVVPIALSAPARADTAHVQVRTYLRSVPRPQGHIVAWVAQGKSLVVLDRKGPWLKVKSGHHTGWVVRSTVQEDEPPPSPETAKPKEQPVEGPAEPPRAPTDEDERRRRWTRADATQHPTALATAASLGPAVVDAAPATPVAPARPPGPVSTRLGAGVGVTNLAMDFTSNGRGELASYRVSAPALAVAVAGDAAWTHRRLVVGADATYRYTWASPGIRYTNAAGSSNDVPFSVQAVDAGARTGILVGRAQLAVRAGYHYEYFDVTDPMNAARMPREMLQGLVTGLLVEVAQLTNRLSLRASADLLSPATRQQTPGQQDGTGCTTMAVYAAIGGRLALPDAWSLEGAYRYGWASTDWNGMSTRQSDVTWAHRTDESHTLTMGLSRVF